MTRGRQLKRTQYSPKNMRRPTEERPFTNYSLDEVICDIKGLTMSKKVVPGSDDGPIKRKWLFFYDVPSRNWYIQCDCARQQQSRAHFMLASPTLVQVQKPQWA